MANRRSKVVRTEPKKINKAQKLRDLFNSNPDISFAEAKQVFAKDKLKLASAQFYSIRGKSASNKAKPKTRRRKKIQPAAPPVVSAKTGCMVAPQTAAELYQDPSLSTQASTQPPNVQQTLEARNLIERAYLEAWQLVGQNYELVDVIVDDIQARHTVK